MSDLIVFCPLLGILEGSFPSLLIDEEPALGLFFPASDPGWRDLRGAMVFLRGSIGLFTGTFAMVRELIENFAKK